VSLFTVIFCSFAVDDKAGNKSGDSVRGRNSTAHESLCKKVRIRVRASCSEPMRPRRAEQNFQYHSTMSSSDVPSDFSVVVQ